MDCVSCGLEIENEVWWAVYAWDAFDLKELEAMSMHETCFTAGEFIEAQWWENDPETNEAILRTEHQRRLLRAPGSGVYIWAIDPTTSEPGLIPYVAKRGASRG